ncbi:hypothetical protein P7C73_g4891, partial [Tremellales sp. Uapishka_1]
MTTLEAGPSTPRQLAYLGPVGTYGYQAAITLSERIAEPVHLVPCPSISSTYASTASYIVLPLQNTLHGGVIETLDCLLSSHPGSRPHIIADLDLPIRHCLVARKGTKMADLKWIRSHEQALGQSSAFLESRLPGVRLYPWASTAGAALSLLEKGIEHGEGGAICSKSVVGLYPDQLEVLYEGTQGIDGRL